MPDNPQTNLPALDELAAIPQWVGWKYVTKDGEQRKVPFQVNGKPASSTNPATWNTFETCRETFDKLGFVLRPPHLGVDLDGCRDPETGAIDAWAQEIIDEFCSYTEVSPSGTGVKIFATADPTPKLGSKKLVIEKREDGKNKQIEFFTEKRYFCVTGQHLEDTPDTIEDATEAAERLAHRLNSQNDGPFTTGLPDAFSTLLRRDSKLSAAWSDGKKLGRGKDTSASGLDMSLALYLSRHLNDEDLETVLRAFPHGQIGSGSLKGANADRRIKDLLSKAAVAREVKPEKGKNVTQDEIAAAFVDMHKDELRYCHTAGAWYRWMGSHWQKDETRLAFAWTRRTGRDLGFDGKASSCAGAEKFSQADERVAVTHETWDADTNLIGTPDGTVDLRTGELRTARQEDFITKLTAVTPAATSHPRWSKFLHETTGGDEELIRFLQRVAGYCLTGDVSEHALFFVYGPGGNGKSVFLNVLTHILGDYATTSSMDTFQASQSDRHPTDLAMLAGARLVTASETEEGRMWAESRIKQLTGGDPITARFMRQDFFTYQPHFKLVIVGNHKPALRNVDDAARRRFNIIPFTRKPDNPDPYLEQKLKDEYPAILQWMIDGCLDWQAEGLGKPQVVADATNEYFEEQDLFGQWMAERCIVNPAVSDTAAKLFADWREFAEHAGIPAGTTTAIGNKLRKAGMMQGKSGGQRGWKGVTCRHASPKEGWEGHEGQVGTGSPFDAHTRARAHTRMSDNDSTCPNLSRTTKEAAF